MNPSVRTLGFIFYAVLCTLQDEVVQVTNAFLATSKPATQILAMQFELNNSDYDF